MQLGDFDNWGLWEGKDADELLAGQWYWLVPGLASEWWLESMGKEAKKAGAKLGFAGYHGSTYECAIWDEEEAAAKLEELEGLARQFGFERAIRPVYLGEGLSKAAQARHWLLVEEKEESGG